MKKYVRIDNGIYKVGIDKEAKESGVSNYYYIEVGKRVRLSFDEEELNKSKLGDTKEELCDRYVLDKIDIIFLNKEHTKYRFENSDEWFDITDIELKKGIYGAIWTDKGLIYVAKMNEKGNLE